MTATFYDTLEVEPHASNAEIKKAYRRKVRSAHPDAGGSNEEFTRVHEAYETLSDAAKRTTYDATLLPAAEPLDSPDEDIDLDWGVEEDVAVPTYAGEVPHTADLRAPARFPLASVSIAAVVGFVIFAAWSAIPSIDAMNQATATAAANTAIALFPLVALRSFPAKFRRSSAVLNLAALAALVTLAVKMPNYGVALGFGLAMLLSGELYRFAAVRVIRWSNERRYPPLWEALVSAAGTRGFRRLWVTSATLSPRRVQVVTLWDPYRRAWEQHAGLPSVLPVNMWVVLDPAGRLVMSCPDKAREVWESLRA